ncbi:MAG: DEAD/DEAH box helicase [Deltaproteobacteria bacterium]|nr:DEAD/DEAH box helicase [Deltaproteobacteria bacterium]
MIPVPGQLVEVRRSRFVVTDVRESTFALAAQQKPQHVVGLSSVEDVDLGSPLEVVWEIEPGARVHENAGLPDPRSGFDPPRRHQAFLDAVRWGAIASADAKVLQAPFRSGIQVETYQLEPVVRALSMPRVSLLLADDVGLGKTIESGLVLQELTLRHRVRTALVVCPAALCLQWRDHMRDKFGLEFRIVDAELMRELRRARGLRCNPWTHFPRLIVSIDYLKRDRPLRLMKEVLPSQAESFPRRFDLLIVDEAHHVAPSGVGRYAIDSLRTQAVRTIVPHFEHKLFLSATPHNGYAESFSALLELLDDQRFHRGVEPNKEQLHAVMVRRLKSEIVNWDDTPRFPKRELAHLEVAYPDAEREAHALLERYSVLRREVAASARAVNAAEFVTKLLKKRLFSSPAAFLSTLEKHRATVEGKRHAASRRDYDRFDDDDLLDDEYDEAESEVLFAASGDLPALSQEEKTLVDKLTKWARSATAKGDAKLDALFAWLEANICKKRKWGDERAIIFTEYRTTQNWLLEQLASAGLAGENRVLMLYGGMPQDDREAIKAAFQAGPKQSVARLLLATDAASEGIDLQNHCSRLVHYEIPWNPNRLEQRNGRIDRHGQRAKQVDIFHFVGAGFSTRGEKEVAPGSLEGDLEFLARAAVKVEQIREDLGKVGPVISQQVSEAMLGRRKRLETAAAESATAPIKRLLKLERRLKEDLAAHKAKLDESRATLSLSPDRVRAVVEEALAIAKKPPLREVAVTGGKGYRLPKLDGSWARSSEGLRHPHTGEERPIVFDPALAEERDDVVLAHLNHRLVRMSLGVLRAQVWTRDERRALQRVTTRTAPNHVLDAPMLVLHGRLLILGADNHRLHEEILTAGARVREGKLTKATAKEVDAALAAATDNDAPAPVRDKLATLWPKHEAEAFTLLERRAEDRFASLTKMLAERGNKEAEQLEALLTELRARIEAALAEDLPAQLPLFADNERQQLERNRKSLAARVQAIPREIERESKALRARYSGASHRLFAVAVTYLVPEGLT